MPQPSRPLRPARLLLAGLVLTLIGACVSTRPAPLQTVQPVKVDVTVPTAAIEAVVLRALDQRRWRVVRPFDRGVLLAERPYGNGKARIRARVARGAVHLDYVSSDNFDYAVKAGQAVIDSRYNGWMDLLRSEIEFGVLTMDATAPKKGKPGRQAETATPQ